MEGAIVIVESRLYVGELRAGGPGAVSCVPDDGLARAPRPHVLALRPPDRPTRNPRNVFEAGLFDGCVFGIR